MKRKIDWPNHITGFAVVLVGVLLAFQLNTWAEGRRHQKLVDQHLQNILEETRYNRNNIDYTLRTARENVAVLDSLMGLLATEGADLRTVNDLTVQLLNFGGLYIRQNAYSSLTQSGDVRYIKDFDTRTKIVNLYEYYDWMKVFENISLKSYTADIYEYIKAHFDLFQNSVQDKEVYYNQQFLTGLASYRYTLNAKITKFESCMESMGTYLEEMGGEKEDK